jgi:hypothetical protein
MNLIDKIFLDIREKYGSLSKPNFLFVQEAKLSAAHQNLINILSEKFSITEDTDTNYDVSFGFLLRRENEDTRSIQISMVGPYCLLMSVKEDGTCVLVDRSTAASPIDRELIGLLSEASLQVLDEMTLLVPVDLVLCNTEPGNSRVFQALFTDTDQIPWRWNGP